MKTNFFTLLFLLLQLSFCNKEAQVKSQTMHNYFALRDITLGKENQIYLSVRSAHISKDKIKEAFQEFQELHSENKMKRTYWKCTLKKNDVLECDQELKIKDNFDEVDIK